MNNGKKEERKYQAEDNHKLKEDVNINQRRRKKKKNKKNNKKDLKRKFTSDAGSQRLKIK